jgi:ABC-2 type transport system ATP-binding protein
MLDLIRRIGRDFGISMLMSSHLLGEIERVCDSLVVIDAGRLMRSDTIASFTASKQVLTVEVDERQEELKQRLEAKGLEVRQDGQMLLISLNGNEPYDLVRDAVVDLGVGLLRMEQGRHRLEDLFRPDGEETGDV